MDVQQSAGVSGLLCMQNNDLYVEVLQSVTQNKMRVTIDACVDCVNYGTKGD